MRFRRLRAVALLAAVTCAALGGSFPAAATPDTNLVVMAKWRAPADTGDLPMLAADSAAGVGYLLSSKQLRVWDRVQAVSLTTGRPLSPLVSIPPLENRAPVVVDTKRHVLTYVEVAPPLPGGGQRVPAAGTVVGIGLRGGAVRQLYRVTTRLPATDRLVGLSLDDSGDDLVVLGEVDGTNAVAASPAGGPAVTLDRLSVDGLMHNTAVPTWTKAYDLPAGVCAALVSTSQPAAVLVVGTRVVFGCGMPTGPLSTGYAKTSGVLPGVVSLSGVTRDAAPSISSTFYPAPGKYEAGETYADRRTRRFMMTATLNGGQTMRVFDTDHGRYVGSIKATGTPFGAVSDPRTGRLYFSGGGALSDTVLGRADLAPLVPSQGVTQRDPFAGMIAGQNAPLRLTFDPARDRLFMPYLDTSRTPAAFSVAVVRDNLAAYTEPPSLDADAGALDTVDRPGLTDSNRSSSARAFGADYQLVGGVTNIVQNTGGNQGATTRPGTRSLRQAYIKQASLGSDGSAALAVAAEEDSATDADRSDAGAGSSFVAPAVCADFGSSPTKRPVVAISAQVTCDLEKEQTRAAAAYTGNDAPIMTTQGTSAPVPAPVQVGRSSAQVLSQRLADRGALQTTVTATAENVTVLGVVTFGKVTSTAVIATNGRRSGAVASLPKVDVAGVLVNGTPICPAGCSIDQLATAVNGALNGRAYVQFPRAQVTRSRGGTTVGVAQDPWYHAERVLDYDKADDDYAVPAMTVVVYLDGTTKSRLVVDLAAVASEASYRIFALDKFTGDTPTAAGGTGPSVLTVGGTTTVPGRSGPGAPSLAAPGPAAATDQGFVAGLTNALRLGLRSPAAALPLLFIWALLALPEYLAARRRLLLELPMLTREQDIA